MVHSDRAAARALAWAQSRWAAVPRRWRPPVLGGLLVGLTLAASGLGFVGVQLGVGPMSLGDGQSSTVTMPDQVGQWAYFGDTTLENTTSSPITLVAAAPADYPQHARVRLLIVPNTMAMRTNGGVRQLPPNAAALPLVIPPHTTLWRYLVAVAVKTARPEYAAVWGVQAAYWWRGGFYHDFIAIGDVACPQQGPACQSLAAQQPNSANWPASGALVSQRPAHS